jgi:hypothetical protein
MREYEERLFLRPVEVRGNEHVGANAVRIPCSLRGRVRLVAQRRPRKAHQINVRQITEPLEEHDVVNPAIQCIDLVLETLDVAFQELLNARD